MKKLLLNLLLIIIILLPFFGARAASISVKPKNLSINAQSGKVAEAVILVTNVGDEPTLYQVYPDLYQKNIIISPADFQLEAGGNREVIIKTKMWRNGKYDFDLSIVARPLNASGMIAAAGVKVPVGITVFGWYFWGLVALMLFVVFIIIFYLPICRKTVAIVFKKIAKSR